MGIRFRHIISALIFTVLSSCGTVKFLPEQIQGTYIQLENKNVQLRFDEGTFIYIDTYQQTHLPPFDCCDTITHGYWELEKEGLIKLFSDPQLYLPVNVEVKESRDDNDSLYFIISNPIEDTYKSNGRKNPGILYSLYIDSDKRSLSNNFSRYYDSNRITISNSEGGQVRSFSINVYPKHTFRGRNIGVREVETVEYVVQNPSSNIFTIDIPKLDNGYITYIRLNDDYVKIINKNKLIWDGQEYVKSQ